MNVSAKNSPLQKNLVFSFGVLMIRHLFSMLRFSREKGDLKKFQEDWKGFRELPKTVQDCVQLANILNRQGESDEALRVLDDTHHNFTKNPLPLIRKGQILNAVGMYQEASNIARSLVDRFPGKVQGYWILARALDKQGALGEALEVLERAHRRRFNQEGLIVFHMELLIRHKRVDKARELLRTFSDLVPSAEHILYFEGMVHMLSNDYEKAIASFKDSMNRFPSLLCAYRQYEQISVNNNIAEKYKDSHDVVRMYMEQCVASSPDTGASYVIYGKWLFDALGESKEAYEILLKGAQFSNHPEIAVYLFKISMYAGEYEEAQFYQDVLEKRGANTYIIPFLPARYIEDCKKGLPPHKTLDAILPRHKRDISPTIIDAEREAFKKERSEGEKYIALFAYATPRPNLDVMQYFYKSLKNKYENVMLFFDKNNIESFDFSDIEFEEGQVVYAASPDFFSYSSFISCVITNDMARLNGRNLPEGCSLILHAPHNTRAVGNSYVKAHYFTFLPEQRIPEVEEIQEVPQHLDRYCAIPNSYTKNEVLFDFFTRSPKPIRAISYCPTTVPLLQTIGLDDFWQHFEVYSSAQQQMIRRILDTFPEYFFIFRPWLGNHKRQNWLVAKRIVDEFAAEERFIFDQRGNSKYTMLLSDVMITDRSGLAVTYAELTQRPFVKFDPCPYPPPTPEAFNSATIRAESVDDVVRACQRVLDRYGEKDSLCPDTYPPEIRAKFNGVSYLVDNMEYILEDKTHPDWKYYDLT